MIRRLISKLDSKVFLYRVMRRWQMVRAGNMPQRCFDDWLRSKGFACVPASSKLSDFLNRVARGDA